jgi:hypothetical protein
LTLIVMMGGAHPLAFVEQRGISPTTQGITTIMRHIISKCLCMQKT